MDYHVAANGKELGLYPEEEVRAKLAYGSLNSNALVWTEGMAVWKPINEVFARVSPPPIPPIPSSQVSAQNPPLVAIERKKYPKWPMRILFRSPLLLILTIVSATLLVIVSAIFVRSRRKQSDINSESLNYKSNQSDFDQGTPEQFFELLGALSLGMEQQQEAAPEPEIEVVCPVCGGTGLMSPDSPYYSNCRTCNGKGLIRPGNMNRR